MRIRANCGACDRDFLFFQLRHADPWKADRCPHCDRPLGVRGLLAVRAEQALAVLVASLEELGHHGPNFTVQPGTVLRPIQEALTAIMPVEAAGPPPPRRHRKRLRAAA